MKIDKHNKDVRLVKIEELEGKKLIPTDLVFYHADSENCKVEVYILNKDKTKMKTFEDFKNKVDNNVEFSHRSIHWGGVAYYKGADNKREYPLYSGYADGLVRYNLIDRENYGYNDFVSFTTVEDIENFVAKREAKLADDKKAKEQKTEKFNSIIDDSLNF